MTEDTVMLPMIENKNYSKHVCTHHSSLHVLSIPMNLLYQDGANTTISVLRTPAGDSEYGWMLEKSLCLHVNPRKP